MSKAENIARNWTTRKTAPGDDDLKGLPRHVQEAISDVVATSLDLGKRVELAEQLWDDALGDGEQHPLALEPGHSQSSRAYRFEEVDGEIIEIRKESHDAPVQIIHRPELVPASDVDPLSALEARLAAANPDAEADDE